MRYKCEKKYHKNINNKNIKFLAEKIETREDFLSARDLGYAYFQGYFFSKPVLLSGKDIPSTKLTYFHLLQDINKQDIDFTHIENHFKKDVSLSYKLLKFINSGTFSFRMEINSIKQALVMLGQKGISKWFSLVALKHIGKDKPNELVITAISRALFCESISKLVGLKNYSSELFLMGMFSLIDAFLDQPLPDVLAHMPISEEIKKALLGENSRFSDIYNMILLYEKGAWETIQIIAAKFTLKENDIVSCYRQSLELANQMYSC